MKRKKIDYRHYICIGITLICLTFTIFAFPNALGRMIESGRDFGLSIAYYFTRLFGYKDIIKPTVNNLPKIPFFNFLGKPVEEVPTFPIASTWEDFKTDWKTYWRLWISKDSFSAYGILLLEILYYISAFIPMLIIFVIAVKLAFFRVFNRPNFDDNKDSKALSVMRKLEKVFYVPIRNWCVNFINFVRERKQYYILWLCIWAFNFNLFTIVIEFVAFYFYFSQSFDFKGIYRQVYKLFIDISPMLRFIPLWLWLIVAFVLLIWISTKMAYKELRRRERCNRGFANERSLVLVWYGSMGTGKTLTATDILLSYEVQLRDDALEIVLECDMMFPNFPWINLQREFEKAVDEHTVFDKWSCVRWIQGKKQQFLDNPCRETLFDYDYKRYGLFYDDKLKVENIWDVLQDYACAYMIYSVQCSLLITTWSIRTDNLFETIGNFPLWDCDFFDRDSRLIDSFSRHSHILDFDMLRFGKKILKNNPNRNALGFGCYGITEIDKERKNTLELKEVQAVAEECNQKNDFFNICIKMIRHAAVIRGRCFIRIVGDLQRTGSLGADLLELGENALISERPPRDVILPYFSPFWLFSLLFEKLKSKWDSFYLNAIYNRSDNHLRLYLLKNIMAKLETHYKRVCNVFGSRAVTVEVESGRMDGTRIKKKYYDQDKKNKSKRYSTDCHSGIFAARAEKNFVGIADLREYADEMAKQDELLSQNSHYQNDIYRYAQEVEDIVIQL